MQGLRRPSSVRRPLRDFNRRKYGNPLFPARARKTYRGTGEGFSLSRRTVVGALVALLLGGVAWYAFWSPSFRITAIEVQGASPATEEIVRAALERHMNGSFALVFPRRNVFFFGDGAAERAIKDAVYLEQLNVRKKLPGTVIVEAAEKATKAALLAKGKLYAVDANGFVIRELTPRESGDLKDLPPEFGIANVPGLGAETVVLPDAAPAPAKENRNPIPLIIDDRPEQTASAAAPGTAAFSQGTLSLILQAYARLPDIAGPVRWFTIREAAESADARIEGLDGAPDWTIHFSTAISFDVQGERLALVLKEKIGSRKADLDYVDLRYNERIFFKFRDAPQAKPGE